MAFDTNAYTGATYDQPTGGFLNTKEVKATWAEVNQSCLMRNAQILSATPSQEIRNGAPTLKVYHYAKGPKSGKPYIRWRFDVAELGKNRWCSFSVFVDCLSTKGDIDFNSQSWQALRNDFGILANVDINNAEDLREKIVPTNNGGFIKYEGLEGLILDFMVEVTGVYNGHANANLVQIFKGEKSTRETFAAMRGQTLNQTVSDTQIAWSRVRTKGAFDLTGGLPPGVPGGVPTAPSVPTAPQMPQMPRQSWQPQPQPQPQTAAPQMPQMPQNSAPADDDVPF